MSEIINFKIPDIPKIQEAYEEVKKLTSDGFQWKDLKGYVAILAKAIESSGIFFEKTGTEKKELLINILSSCIDIKWIPNFIEKFIISFIINSVVNYLNNHNWNIEKFIKKFS